MYNQSFPQPGVLPKNPKLSVCMIVCDEEDMLHRCLKSVRSVADELIVVDTGSKDNTISIANDFGAKVFHFKWCDDFAAARNEYLKHATGDWILVIDADEELLSDSIAYLKDCILRPNVIYYVTRCDNGLRYEGPRFSWVVRLFRRHPKIVYNRPYHEAVDSSVEGLILAEPQWQVQHEPNIIIRHYAEIDRKHERCLQIMKPYLKEIPDDDYTLARLGEACCGLGRYDEAEQYLKKALEINPNCALTNFSLGLTLQKQGRPEAVIERYKKAIAIDPNFTEAHGNLGAIYIQKGMLNEAISELQKAINHDFDNAVGHNMLGLAYYKTGSIDKAIAHYKHALSVDPNNAEVHFNLGIAYGHMGMTNEEIAEYKRAIAIKPDYAEAHNNLAVAYYLENHCELAIQHCDKAIALGLKINPEFLEDLKSFR